MFQNGQKVCVVTSGDPTRVIKVRAGTGDPSRVPVVTSNGVTGRDQQVQVVSGGDATRYPILNGVNPILALSPAAYYEYGVGVTSAGGFASMWADQADSDNSLVLPGVAGNHATTPDSVPLSITGDLDIQLKVALNDWTPAATNRVLVSKYAFGGSGYELSIDATGELRVRLVSTGPSDVTATSTVATGITDGAVKWIRVTVDVDNGAAGKDIKFYLSDDGSAWTQLGTTITSAGVLSIIDGATVLKIGNRTTDSATQEPVGKFYRAIIKSGIDGTTVFDANFAAQAKGAASFSESSSNAATVTVNASGALPAHIGSQKDLLQGTGTNQPAYSAGVLTGDGADNFMKANTFALSGPFSYYMVLRQDAWTNGDYLCDGNTTGTGALFQSTSTPIIVMNGGISGQAANSDLAVGTWSVVRAVFNGGAPNSTLKVDANAATTGASSVGVNAAGFTLFAGADGASHSAASVAEIIIFPSVLSAGDDAVVYAHLAAIRDAL